MKKLLILPLLLITIFCSAQSAIIGNPIKLSNLEIAQYTFPNSMNWTEALDICKVLGNGWKLPSKEQLDILYRNKEVIGGFVNDAYWSATSNGEYEAWRQYFSDGDQVLTPNISVGYVRPIREIDIDSSGQDTLVKTELQNTPEDFARTVFLALKDKNFDLYETTAPTFLEVKRFLESIKNNQEYTEEFHNYKKSHRLEWFLRTITEVENLKLDLNESKYCGFEGKIETVENQSGIKKGFICFVYKSKKYQIVADKVWQINNKWKSVENLLGIQIPEIEKEVDSNSPIKTPSQEELDKELAEFLSGPKIEIQSSGENVSEYKFSKGIPFATTINTASDNRKYSVAKLAQLNSTKSIVGTPVKIGKLLISQNEFPLKMNWSKAKLACQKLGTGWRLPTKDELYILYLNRNKIGNFSKYGYWSLTEDTTNGAAWWQDFYLGSTKPSIQNKLSTWGVRAVKTP